MSPCWSTRWLMFPNWVVALLKSAKRSVGRLFDSSSNWLTVLVKTAWGLRSCTSKQAFKIFPWSAWVGHEEATCQILFIWAAGTDGTREKRWENAYCKVKCIFWIYANIRIIKMHLWAISQVNASTSVVLTADLHFGCLKLQFAVFYKGASSKSSWAEVQPCVCQIKNQ